MRKKNRLLAIFMTFVLLFSSLNFAVSAESAPAAAPTRVTEVEVMRQTNSETYIMSDGSYECVVYAYDKYYEDADKSLQLVDNRIVPAKTEMRSGKITADKTQYKNAANAFDVHFSASGTPEVSIAYQNASVTFSPVALSGSREAATFSVGKVTAYRALNELAYTGDNTVTYANAFPNTDLVYVLENNSLKEYIILNNTNAANTFRFSFTLDGVTLRSMDKYAEFVDENGATLFALDSLFAVDSAGVFTDALTYSFTPVTGTNKLTVTVTLDNAYLSDPDRVFPVIIDPTVMISSSETADACVCSYTPNTNYQGATQLRTGMDTDYGIRRSYINFNIPSYIPTAGVTNAVLEIEKLSGVAPTMRAYACSGYWHSGTITWANKPGYRTDDASGVSTRYSSTSTWYTMNVTEIVRSWLNLEYSNYGFVLKDNTENNTNHWTTLYSSDAPSPHKPELHITYTTFFGCRPFAPLNNNEVNCLGYAFDLYGKFDPITNHSGWDTTTTSAQALSIATDAMEGWLISNFGTPNNPNERWYVGTQYSELNNNQWLVVMRVGVRKLSEEAGYGRDFHFWYRTNTGSWAHKQGNGPSELLPMSVSPTSSTTAWDTVFERNGAYFECHNFYDSEPVYYVLTI